MMYLLKKIVVSIIIIASHLNITSCSLRPVLTIDSAPLPADMGVLVVGLHANLDSTYIPTVSSGLRLHYAQKEQKNDKPYALDFKGSNYVYVVTLQKGTYTFFRLDAPSIYIDIKESNDFVIEPDTITYVGEIFIDMQGPHTRIWVEDGFNKMTDYLKENYPQHSKKYVAQKSIIKIEQKALSDILTER